MMKHKGCGGEISEDWDGCYEYRDDQGSISKVPSLWCDLCGAEILGDAMIADDDEAT